MVLNRRVINGLHLPPAILSISLYMLSRPVALPRDCFFSTEDISLGEMGVSIGSSLNDSGGEFEVKYAEQRRLDLGQI